MAKGPGRPQEVLAPSLPLPAYRTATAKLVAAAAGAAEIRDSESLSRALMQKLRLQKTTCDDIVGIFVDETDLKTFVRFCEYAFDGRDVEDPYAGISWLHAIGQGSVFDLPLSPGRKVVMVCSCGIGGCWDLEVDMKLDIKSVTWQNFRNDRCSSEMYKDIGPFIFDRKEYEMQVHRINVLFESDAEQLTTPNTSRGSTGTPPAKS